MVSEKNGRVLAGCKNDPEKFTDTYHFIRKENQWSLHYIDNDVTPSDLIKARNYRE